MEFYFNPGLFKFSQRLIQPRHDYEASERLTRSANVVETLAVDTFESGIGKKSRLINVHRRFNLIEFLLHLVYRTYTQWLLLKLARLVN